MARNPNCQQCDLYKGATTVCVYGRGDRESGIMFIGEAPGAEEDQSGLPFVGQAGQKFDDIGARYGIRLGDTGYVTNICKCRPPNNKAPKISEQHACFNYLKEEIMEIKPWLIVLLGAVPCKKVLGVASLKEVRDVVQDIDLIDLKSTERDVYHHCKVFAMYHPSAILRTPELASSFEDEIATIAQLIDAHAGKGPAIQVMDESHHFVIDNLDTLRKFCDKMETAPRISFDLETTGFDYHEDEVLLAACSWRDHYAAVITLYGQDMAPLFKDSYDDAWIHIERLARHPSITGQNYSFDKKFFMGKGIKNLPPTGFDIMLAHHLVWEYLPHNLTDICLQLKVAPRYDADLYTYPGAKESFANIPHAVLIRYAANDADVEFRAEPIITSHPEWAGLRDLYYKIVLPCQEVITQMEFTGVVIDEERLLQLRNQLTKELRAMEERLRAQSYKPEDFNWRSYKQITKELYDVRDLPIVGRTKTITEEHPQGTPSTKKWELEELIRQRGGDVKKEPNSYERVMGLEVEECLKFLMTLHQIKKHGKVCSTYVGYSDVEDDEQKGMHKHIKRGRIHTDYHLEGTATGRYSSKKPNLQNIPRGFDVRGIFTVEPGHVFVSADYAQAELRVLAWLAKDPDMKATFLAGADIHSEVAMRIYNKGANEITYEERVTAKFVNFGIAYQRGAQSIADQIGCTKEEGQKYIDGFYNTYPMVRLFIDECKRAVIDPGYVQNQYGRRRRFLPTDHQDIHAEYERQAVNFMCQGNVADTLSKATVDVACTLNKLQMKSYLIMTLHDAIMLSVLEEELDKVKAILQLCMADNLAIPGLDLHLPIDITVSERWGESKDDLVMEDSDA